MTALPLSRAPVSAVAQGPAFLSLFGMTLVIGIFRWFDLHNPNLCFMLIVTAIAAPHIWPFGAVTRKKPDDDLLRERIMVKCLGLFAVYAIVASAYFLFWGYYVSFVQPLSAIWTSLWLPVLCASPAYIYFTDRLMPHPEDGLYQFGRLVTGQLRRGDWAVIKQFVLGWAVKGFFAPLMVGFALKDIQWALNYDFAKNLMTAPHSYELVYRIAYLIDVAFAATGYLCTFRLFNSEIRSTEPTMFGWVVCIMCYPPFWSVFQDNFLKYEEDYYWGNWLASHDVLWICWAVLIAACLVIYSWTTVSFGMRFSNLTNRGILTNGPYRWMKHPAYVSKNISWWLISVPFVTNSPDQSVLRNCLALLCLNAIYVLRAKTEERHLMRDPAYVEYSAWMKTNSAYAKFMQTIGLHA
jgi:protein-S-isoprenylcysteine O-methyltransferase Ste14